MAEVSSNDIGNYEHWLAKKGKKIEIFVKVLTVDTGVTMNKSKTIGTITRKNCEDILMCAHSGYSTGPTREDVRCLNTKRWNHLALHHLARQIDFKFPGNIRDTAGRPVLDEYRGRAHAGHVEVLLASWYVVDTLRSEFEYVSKSEEWCIKQLRRLKRINLGDRRVAFINIDSEPCKVCLQFLHRLSQHTGIIFPVSGSLGIGPIQVRVEGERRSDTVGEVFPDSEDELPEDGNRPPDITTESPNDTQSDTLNPDLPVPATPGPRSVLRRPGSSWKHNPIPWTPEDAEKLLSEYKKKTPVYQFPGYDRAPSSSSEIGPEIEDSTNEWKDVGDGVMMHCTSVMPSNPEGATPVKCERPPPLYSPSPAQSYAVSNMDIGYANGSSFARSAYDVVQETIEVEGPPRPLRPHRRNHESTSSTRMSRQLKHQIPRLQDFRRKPICDNNESIFKTRYSILKPKHRYLDPQSRRVF